MESIMNKLHTLEDVVILLDIKQCEFAYLLKKSGINSRMLANTEGAKELRMTANVVKNRLYKNWIKDIEPLYAIVLLDLMGYPLMKELRAKYKQERQNES